MSDKNTGGSAFPSAHPHGQEEGMSLRDYFAAKAMQADLSRVGYYSNGEYMLRAAKNAYSMADAMLEAGEQ